jgi:hypothetical protein
MGWWMVKQAYVKELIKARVVKLCEAPRSAVRNPDYRAVKFMEIGCKVVELDLGPGPGFIMIQSWNYFVI